jgi:hypothetical protein
MSVTDGIGEALAALTPKHRRARDRLSQERADQARVQAMDRAHRVQATFRAQEDHALGQFEDHARRARAAAIAAAEDEKIPAAT